jgi:hypothetical protein
MSDSPEPTRSGAAGRSEARRAEATRPSEERGRELMI